MGASSVTGVGPGSVEGLNQGSKHTTFGVGRLIGPRVMAADTVTLDGSGDAEVVLPKMTGNASDYIVVATDRNVSAAAAVGAVLANGSDDSTITFKGTSAHVISWAIIKIGLTN